MRNETRTLGVILTLNAKLTMRLIHFAFVRKHTLYELEVPYFKLEKCIKRNEQTFLVISVKVRCLFKSIV